MKINWNDSAVTPSEKTAAPVITGVVAQKPAEDEPVSEWTVDELKAAKPMMVYYFVSETKETEDNFKFCRKTEMSAFSNDAVERINANWIPKKVQIDFDADRKLEKNQARIEFCEIRLKHLEKKNRELCELEIKKIRAEEERRKKEETASLK
jgi:hypothetical protein